VGSNQKFFVAVLFVLILSIITLPSVSAQEEGLFFSILNSVGSFFGFLTTSSEEPFIETSEELTKSKTSNTITQVSPKRIRIINQTGLDKYLNWKFQEIDNITWIANFTFEEDFHQALISCRIRSRQNACWNSLRSQYLPQLKTNEVFKNIKNLTRFPLQNLSKDIAFSNFQINTTNGTGSFIINFPKGFKAGEEAKFGFNSTLITTSTDEGRGNDKESWNHRVFFDTNNERWHVIFVDNGSDLHSSSSADTITWVDGIDIDPGPNDYDDFDCVMDLNGSTTYLHCTYASSSDAVVSYERCELTGSSPFITCNTGEEFAFNSQFQGGSGSDDVSFPKIIIDPNRCVLILFDLENDSEVTALEHQVVLTRESISTTCGDGDFDGPTDDTSDGFPIFTIQNGTGYATQFALGLESFGDFDAQLFWLNTTTSGTYQLRTTFFNGTSNTTSPDVILDLDIQSDSDFFSHWSVIVGNRTITFSMNDTGDRDLDAYITTVRNGTLSSKVDTGIQMEFDTTTSAQVTAVVDTRSPGEDDIWVFAVDDDDDQDIWYSVSPDGGDTWQNQTLWQDEAGVNEIKFLSAFFDNESCQIGVTWLNGSASPFGVVFANISTGSCPPPAVVSGGLLDVTHNNSNVVVVQNTTFIANITITCEGGDCGTVDFTNFFYNISGLTPNIPINTTVGDLNFYNSSGLVNGTCGTLNDGDVCTFSIPLNATGNIGNHSLVGNATNGTHFNSTPEFYVNITLPPADSCVCPGVGNFEIINGDICTLATTCDITTNQFRINNGIMRIGSSGILRATGCFINDSPSGLFIDDGGGFFCG